MENRWELSCHPPELPPQTAVLRSVEGVERALLEKLSTQEGETPEALWQLAAVYQHEGRPYKVLECLRRLKTRASERERVAAYLLATGQLLEQMNDFAGAAGFYREAHELRPAHQHTWYFINNNLGVCLTASGRAVEAESFLRAAITSDPGRTNALNNLGICLEQQGRFADAAEVYIASTRANPGDARASRMLNALLLRHPELQPELSAQALLCGRIVEQSRAGGARGRVA
ncbi:MAG TPA: tetratricopeptide repeat protein [Verrucomicrobiae bacterium]|nr:tetratricopeptide repeat protein [Verrucomicrobiae bacterium]